MKEEKKEKKLRLGKVTVQHLNAALDRDEQKTIKGGTDINSALTTIVPIFCA